MAAAQKLLHALLTQAPQASLGETLSADILTRAAASHRLLLDPAFK